MADKGLPFSEVWEDDTRMNVLFSPFRPKSIDPISWASKQKFWEEQILKYCLHNKQSTFNILDLQKAFARKGKLPTCLEEVVAEMLRTGTITFVYRYKNYSFKQESFLAWSARLLINPVQWVFNQLIPPFNPIMDNEVYLHLAANKEISQKFYANLPDNVIGRLVDYNDLVTLGKLKDEDDLKIVMKPLVEQKSATLITLPDETLVKFAKKGEKSLSVSEIDIGVYKLEKTEACLKKEMESLEEEKDTAMKEVKNCLASNKRQTAKSWLRRKNEIEKYIDKRASALENIRCLLDRIRLTESESTVLSAYKQGVAALKEVFRTKGLSVKETEETMDELEDVLDVHNEIEETLARSLDPEDDTNLESELAEILLESAPNVPPTDPKGTDSGGSKLDFDPRAKLLDSLPISVELPEVPQSTPVPPPNVPQTNPKDTISGGLKFDNDARELLPLSVGLSEVPQSTLEQSIDEILEARIKALAF